MNASLPAIVVTAVVSSLVTVLTVELLRAPAAGRGGAGAPESATTGGGGALVDAAIARPSAGAPQPSGSNAGLPGTSDLLAELERRLERLELQPARRSVPRPGVLPDELPAEPEALRELVLDWVAEDRESRWALEEAEDRARLEQELSFEARTEAAILAREHALPDWQRDRLGDLFLQIELRSHDYDAGIDPLTDDPVEVEEGWVEFDQWADQLLLDNLGEELFEQLFDDDWEEEDDEELEGEEP